jgi:hypothetical protein
MKTINESDYPVPSTMIRNIFDFLNKIGVEIATLSAKDLELYEDQMIATENEKLYLSYNDKKEYFLIKNPITRTPKTYPGSNQIWLKHIMPVKVLISGNGFKKKTGVEF